MTTNPAVHYNIDDLMKTGSLFNIMYGERSNGKSYQLKIKVMLTDAILKGDSRFVLVRRFRDEIKTSSIEWYFNDMDIEKLTDGKYNCIEMYRREIFLATFDKVKMKRIRGKKIGYAIPLEDEQDYAGGSFLDVTDIIFEEFMSRSRYLVDEPNKLMNLYCTIDRKRGTTKLWMCGNTISRVCPYLTDWNLKQIMQNQKQGTIKSMQLPVDDEGTEVKLSIEYCKDTGRTSFTIGSHAEMLNTGTWQSDPQPHLPKSLKCYDTIFTCVMMYKQFTFLCRYISDKETSEKVWFICEKKTEIKNDTWVFSDKISQNKKWFRDIYNAKSHNEKLLKIFSDFRESNIFYSTDLLGTDFKQAIDFIIKR